MADSLVQSSSGSLPEPRCRFCGRPVEQPERGYRLCCPDCEPIKRAVGWLERLVSNVTHGVHPQLGDQALVELRHELFCIVAEMPRPRDRRGRFIRRSS